MIASPWAARAPARTAHQGWAPLPQQQTRATPAEAGRAQTVAPLRGTARRSPRSPLFQHPSSPESRACGGDHGLQRARPGAVPTSMVPTPAEADGAREQTQTKGDCKMIHDRSSNQRASLPLPRARHTARQNAQLTAGGGGGRCCERCRLHPAGLLRTGGVGRTQRVVCAAT